MYMVADLRSPYIAVSVVDHVVLAQSIAPL